METNTILYYIILYYTVVYCTVLYYAMIYTDKTSLKADREDWGEGGGLEFTNRSRAMSLAVLKHCKSQTKPKLPGPLAPGGSSAEIHQNPRKKQQKLTRTHQETPELTQEAPQMLHDLTDPLFKPFRQLSLTT